MTDRNQRNLIEHNVDVPPKAAWVSPAVTRLRASDAEQGGAFTTDLGVALS